MGALVTVKELSKQLEIKESKVRRWTKKGLLTPISKSKQDGKSLLYDLDCARIKLEILDRIRIDFSSLSEIGARFREVFGRRDADLLDALHTTDNRKGLVKKYIEEIRGDVV
jgi:DNA-binding transcriptional MerR regulator